MEKIQSVKYKVKCSIKVDIPSGSKFTYTSETMRPAINAYNARYERFSHEFGAKLSKSIKVDDTNIVGNDIICDISFIDNSLGHELKKRFLDNGGICIIMLRITSGEIEKSRKTNIIDNVAGIVKIMLAINK